MDKRKPAVFSVLLALSMFFQGLPTLACAIDIDTVFSWSVHPEFPFSKYAAGELGIVDGTYARSYLLVAYRYWSENPLSKDEQDAALTVWKQRFNDQTQDCDGSPTSWLSERKQVPGASKIDDILVNRKTSDDKDSWDFFCNCKTDAFVTASNTLKNYITKFGATSPVVKSWLEAQDAVFSNCGAAWDKPQVTAIPAALEVSADKAAQQDRAYQIAAARFYAMQYPEARKDFDAIAADASSPWKNISAYLAVRTLIRQAVLSKTLNTELMNEALQRIKTLSADPSFANLGQSLTDLKNYVMARVAPEQHLTELASEMQNKITAQSLNEYTKTIDLILKDDGESEVDLTYEKLPASVKVDDLTDWLMVYQGGDAASTTHAIAKWKETKSVPWLLAALSSVDSDNAETGALLSDAQQIPKSSRAYWTAFYHVNRIYIAMKKDEETRKRIDAVLAAPPAEMNLSMKNALKSQRLEVAKNLAEFARFGIQQPECFCYVSGMPELPDELNSDPNKNYTPKTTKVFTKEAGILLDKELPLSSLRQLAADSTIPADVRQRLAWTSFVRAILIKDETQAKALATILKQINPRKAPLLNAYLAATTPGARKFTADLLMMEFSSAEPNPGWGPLPEDKYGDASGWWWGAGAPSEISTDDGDEPIQPPFLTAVMKTQAAAELKKLATVATAPNYFAASVLPWAKAHPTDPRVPEALHFFIKSTRYGSTDDSTGALSKKAFQLLHSKYKGSPWTKKTPYYF